MEQIHQYTIKLIRYVLNGDIPQLPENVDFEALFAFTKSHGIENMIYVALRDLKVEVPEQTMQKFREAYDIAIMIEAVQAIELEQISNAFEEAGIDHIPLKGSVVKYLYPMPDYRQSGDMDILIHPKDEQKIDEILNEYGYERLEKADYHKIHSVYIKQQYIQVEMHRRLVHKDDRARVMCEKVWSCVELQSGKKHVYSMNNEFLYMYTLAHLRKHLYKSGAGLRMIMDLWVILNKKDINKDRMKSYLEKSKLSDINRLLQILLDVWFNDKKDYDNKTDMLARLIFASGSFGSMQSLQMIVDNDVKRNQLKRFKERLFPSYAYFSERYNFVKNRPFLMPIACIMRWISILIHKRDMISVEIRQNFGTNNKKHDMKEIIDAIK